MLAGKTLEAILKELVNTKNSEIDLSDFDQTTKQQLRTTHLELSIEIADLLPTHDLTITGLDLLIRAINENPNIKVIKDLKLENCNLNDDDLLKISKLKNIYIKNLVLSGNNFSLQGYEYLVTNLWDEINKKAMFEHLFLHQPQTPLVSNNDELSVQTNIEQIVKKIEKHTIKRAAIYQLELVKPSPKFHGTGNKNTSLVLAKATESTTYTNPLHTTTLSEDYAPIYPTIHIDANENCVRYLENGFIIKRYSPDYSVDKGGCSFCTIM